MPATTADHAAYAALVTEETRRRMIGKCARMLGSPEEAEDVVQSALLAAYTHWPVSPSRAWLWKIVMNRCIDRLRRAHHWQYTALDTIPLAGDAPPLDVQMIRDEAVADCMAALDLVRPEIRATLMAYADGASYTEIGAGLGIGKATVATRIWRGRAAVKRAMDVRAMMANAGR